MNIIRKFNNILWFYLLFTASALVILTAQSAFADFWGAGAPDWSSEAGYTNQIWEFTDEVTWAHDPVADVVPPAEPDTSVNSNRYKYDPGQPESGPGLFRVHGEASMPNPYSWAWVDEGPMNQNWVGLQGMLGGMGKADGEPGAFEFFVPLPNMPGTTKVWLQYVSFVPDNKTLEQAILASDISMTNAVGNLKNRAYDKIPELEDQGGTGDWFRITEEWEVKDAGEVLFLRVRADVPGTSNMVDSVQVMTHTISPDIENRPPEVSETDPADNQTDVPVDADLKITFSKSMDKVSTRTAFSITPDVDGDFSWSSSDSVLTFTPKALLSHQIPYQVTITVDATDDSGHSMTAPYSFTFTTQDYIAPVPELSDTVSGTVEQDSVSITVGGTAVYGYRYSLDNGEWSEAADTSVPLALAGLTDGDHTLKIQVRDSQDQWFDTDPISWTVMAPPRIVFVSPQGRIPTPETIEVEFNEAMDTQSVTAALEISPAVTGTITWRAGDKRLVYTPDPRLNPESDYTVTIGTGAKDAAGNALSEPYSWSFTTLQVNMVTCPVSADTYVLFGGMGGGGGYPQGSSRGEPRLKAGAVSIVDARALMRFDLSPITDLGLTAEDVVTANLVYNMLENSAGMDVGPVAPEGEPMYGFVHVLDTLSREKTGEKIAEPFFWTEALTDEGYVNMDNKPGYVADSPVLTVSHSTGHDTPGKFDIAPLVRGWLDGRWPNNGIELRDQDDASDQTSDIGDGYSWHFASREDTAKAPYLEVFYDTQRLRIKDRGPSAKNMSPGQRRDLSAGGGNSGDYQWKVIGSDGIDITASTLSEASGAVVTFTAPDLTGMVTIVLTSGDASDRIFIGIGDASGNGSSRSPLYLSGGTQESDSLNRICDDVLEEMGPFSTITRVTLDTGNGPNNIGGTSQDGGAEMTVTPIDNPSGLSAPVLVSLETSDGQLAEVEISPDSVPAGINRIYVVLADTGNPSASNASNIFLLDVYNENGDPLDEQCNLKVTIPFNPDKAGSNPFTSGDWAMGHAANLKKFLSGNRDPEAEENGEANVDGLSVVPVSDVVSVDEENHTVTFTINHCSVFGLVPGTGQEFARKPDDSLGSGCFIQSLLSSRAGNPGLVNKVYRTITAVVGKMNGVDLKHQLKKMGIPVQQKLQAGIELPADTQNNH